ncbi:MAG: efflux transporter outer membrane subunit, partial [Gammaproteobacteria bacterium]|nr:efflux transporter outer membrane subunit [Gammaproteobacteria bacterium]
MRALPLPLIPLLLATALSGCANLPLSQLGTLIDDASLHYPEKWHAPHTTQHVEVGSAQSVAEWIDPLHAAPLKQLIAEAIAHNHNLQHVALNWQNAKQQTILAGTPLRPTLEGGVRSQRSQTLSNSKSATLTSQHGVTVTAQWEIDLWQRLSDQQRAAHSREQASATDLQAARLSLAATVARRWFSAIESKQKIKLSHQRLARYSQALEVIEVRYRSGLTDALDLHVARSEVSLSKENLLSQQMNQQQQLRELELLLGRYPAAEITVGESLPTINQPIPVGLPSELLERRPDIIASRTRWQAAALDREVAAKRRLPSFSLSAQAGTSSNHLRDLLDWDNLVWSLLGTLPQPLFQQEQLEAEELIQATAQQQAAIAYLESVLQAFREVENGLTADHFQQQRLHALADAADEASKAATLALSRYQNGLIDALTLLDTQQRAFDRESAHIQAMADHIDNR